jgi:diaminopimelate epimerase
VEVFITLSAFFVVSKSLQHFPLPFDLIRSNLSLDPTPHVSLTAINPFPPFHTINLHLTLHLSSFFAFSLPFVFLKVDMGSPILQSSNVPTTLTPTTTSKDGEEMAVVQAPITALNGRSWKVTCVSMGNPHAVIFLEDDDNSGGSTRSTDSNSTTSCSSSTLGSSSTSSSGGSSGNDNDMSSEGGSTSSSGGGGGDGGSCGSGGFQEDVGCKNPQHSHRVMSTSTWSLLAALDLACEGPALEHHPCFPSKTNVEFVQLVLSNHNHTTLEGGQQQQHLAMKVWERGSGVTLACGTGACAVVVAAVLAGKIQPYVKGQQAVLVTLPGGDLEIEWRCQDKEEACQGGEPEQGNGKVFMTGPAQHLFSGTYLPPGCP